MPGARRREAAAGPSTGSASALAGGFFDPGAGRFVTRGQPAALAAIEHMLATAAPQALLLVGPASTGKTTLAMDLAAGLLCTAPDLAARPCRACRACHLVARGTHQDLHHLAPDGAGRQIRIGDMEDPDPGTIRHLIHECVRRPVEGTHRVAVIEDAHRMNEDAQNALLKTLEEPPAGVTIILCAEAPERMLPTIRSRAAILRLGTVATSATEALLVDRGVDPPRAARLARLAAGRPGRALAYAATPDAVSAREEIARSLLDLVAADRVRRLVSGREMLARAGDLARLGLAGAAPGADASGNPDGAAAEPSGDASEARAVAAATPAERRLAARALLETWIDVARDLAVAGAGARARIRDIGLLEDLESTAAAIPAGAAVAFLDRLARAADLLEVNANAELLVDTLVLAWPASAPAA